MSHNDVQKIKERLGIKELVETYIKLEKSGKNYKGRCPFHNEKTPSFFISPDRDGYYCFGCGEKGDIFTFVQKMEGIDFYDSLKLLADKTGIKLSKNSENPDQTNKQIKEILRVSTDFYQNNLKNNSEALSYLKKRGLSEKTIKQWKIGYALNDWKSLLVFLKQNKFSEDLIFKSGMIKIAPSKDKYDTFRSRIMFPIFNSIGETVAFSGRIFGQDDKKNAKYLNSPEGPLFKKSEILYGFNWAKQYIRKYDFAILVEGQMDTIMCHQANYCNAIASSGTALSEEQLKMIYRISSNLIIAFDSDSAGFKASQRAWQMALSIGFDVKIAPISGGKDPADVIKDNVDEWKKIIKNSKHIVEVLIEKIKTSENDKRQVAKKISTQIIPYISEISNNIEQSNFIQMVSDQFDIKEEIIYEEIKRYKTNSVNKTENIEIKIKKDSLNIEKRIFGILMWQQNSKQKIIDVDDLQIKIKNILNDQYDLIVKTVQPDIESMILSLEENILDKKNINQEMKELLINLEIKYLNRYREKLLAELRQAEKSGDEKISNEILKKIDEVSKKMQGINKNN
ncbi:MAG TPA: DNA primase [Candidatus Paceibacterota bacterium]|nr:DNA primase [Candidatus Paceibacterota bacterium]HMP18796.1 DNA primase [Candidatus Paceibacterota bacterium]HMP85399.1 DNA primase [Candidatus Paceibacterota bacterium]